MALYYDLDDFEILKLEIRLCVDLKIIADDPEDSDYFGYSVSISGDHAIVGACYEDGAGTDRGAAYIFE